MRFASPRRIKIILQEKKNPNPLCSGKQINANVFPVTEIQFRVPEHLLPMIMMMPMMTMRMLTVANSIRALGTARTLGRAGINLFLAFFARLLSGGSSGEQWVVVCSGVYGIIKFYVARGPIERPTHPSSFRKSLFCHLRISPSDGKRKDL